VFSNEFDIDEFNYGSLYLNSTALLTEVVLQWSLCDEEIYLCNEEIYLYNCEFDLCDEEIYLCNEEIYFRDVNPKPEIRFSVLKPKSGFRFWKPVFEFIFLNQFSCRKLHNAEKIFLKT